MSKRIQMAHQAKALGVILLAGSVASVALLMGRLVVTHSLRFWFLPWNLLLAWIPLVIAWSLGMWLRRGRWLSWQGIGLTAAWLLFLPNSFYIVSDFIHLTETHEVSKLFDAVLLQIFSLNGLLLGFVSLYVVHNELNRRRINRVKVIVAVSTVLVLCGFAIYLGRSLKWNSWDILVYPGALVLDIVGRLLHPVQHAGIVTTTALFSFFLITMYFVTYHVVGILRSENATDSKR